MLSPGKPSLSEGQSSYLRVKLLCLLPCLACCLLLLFLARLEPGPPLPAPQYGRDRLLPGADKREAPPPRATYAKPPRPPRLQELSVGLRAVRTKLKQELGVVRGVARGGARGGVGTKVASVQQVVLISSWRSGSSFLGELLAQVPGTFYNFEPFHYYASVKNRSGLVTEAEFLSSLLDCVFPPGYLLHVAQPSNTFLVSRHNTRLWKACQVFPKAARTRLCLSQQFLSQACSQFPVRLIKTVRLRVEAARSLLTRYPALQAVLLVRDPRAVFASRRGEAVAAWCRAAHCSDPATSCADLQADILAARALAEQFPGRVHLVRYEDLALDPTRAARLLLQQLGLVHPPGLARYLAQHTARDQARRMLSKKTGRVEASRDPYGTARNSTAAAFAWTASLTRAAVLEIQTACSAAMAGLGYREAGWGAGQPGWAGLLGPIPSHAPK